VVAGSSLRRTHACNHMGTTGRSCPCRGRVGRPGTPCPKRIKRHPVRVFRTVRSEQRPRLGAPTEVVSAYRTTRGPGSGRSRSGFGGVPRAIDVARGTFFFSAKIRSTKSETKSETRNPKHRLRVFERLDTTPLDDPIRKGQTRWPDLQGRLH